jgi:hypothetical protein
MSSDCSGAVHGHCLEVVAGNVFSWVHTDLSSSKPKKSASYVKNSLKFGQLGRAASEQDCTSKGRVQQLPTNAIRVAAGGDNQSGHSAVLTATGAVFTFGCDRWQQLGLGSSSGGTAGYTWLDGKIWQREAKPVIALSSIKVVDIACGFEHTACLCESGEVVTFGRGNRGQLGLTTGSDQRSAKNGPWLSCPTVSPHLSVAKGGQGYRIGAEENCTCTFKVGTDGDYSVANCSGKCDKVGLLERMVQRIRDRG